MYLCVFVCVLSGDEQRMLQEHAAAHASRLAAAAAMDPMTRLQLAVHSNAAAAAAAAQHMHTHTHAPLHAHRDAKLE